ncbi:cupin domain-containing protein [Agarivorans sp. Alg241-V36]|uniref:cupin domain-containing protein n=1 Tax=Agarivorans sp. Alg241-V36 TaxID=2305992 RepID=UPI0013D7730B|nr:cupin domain-containing protein [Agarivorans sp. Alg241-V36]
MNKYNISDFVRGWIVGGFEPTLFNTTDVEFAIQEFKKGDKEANHCHKIATEITVIVQGKALMKDMILNKGDIVKISPGEYTNFEALEDTTTAVIKLPGALNDKYLEE